MVPPLIEVKPGEIVSATFVVENMTDSEETFEEALALPEGWLLVTPPEVFTLGAKEEQVRMLAFRVPGAAEAKEYSLAYSVRSKRNYAIKDEATIRISVLSVSGMKFFLESAPDTVTSGESYEITARLTNGGNHALTVVIPARSSSGYPLTLSANELTLNPGESASVSVSVRTPSKIQKSLKHIVTLEALSEEDPSIRSSLLVVTEVLSQKAKVDLYHRVPATLTLRSMGQRNETDADGFDVELEGKGTLEEGGRRWVEFLFRGPDTEDKGLYGDRDEYYMNYLDPDMDLRLGDQGYGLSYLTSFSRYGRGFEAKYHPEDKPFGFGGYFVKDRFDTPDWEEEGVYVGSSLSSHAKLKLNYFKKEHDSYNASPKVKDDIYSIEGEFNPTGDMKIGLEYAEGERKEGAQKLEDDAYRAEVSGSIGEARYRLNKTHAEPDFYGYYNDNDYMSSSLNFPVSGRARGFFSYSGYETNLDMRQDKNKTANKETLLQTGLNYTLGNGWYTQFAFDNFHRKDKFSPAQYDVKEEAYRLSVGRSAGNFDCRLEARYADQCDRVKGVSASPWNYSFYASYMPSIDLYFTLYGGFGDNSAVEGSRLLSDQDNLGMSFRWQATEQLMLRGWYTKYNFDSKSPESDNYELEVRYTMPDESYWTFQMRRYDWEYGEYTETDYMLSYSIPLGIPVGKKKSLGAVSGRVFDAQAGEAVPIPGAVVTLNGSKAAADASGRFSFTAPPGTYLLNIDRASIGLGRTATAKLPVKVDVEPSKTTFVELRIVSSANFRGRLVLVAGEPEAPVETDELAVIGALGGEPGAYPQGLRGILVEIARDDETMRTLTDDEGRFAFLAIRPGVWKFKVYDYNLPAYHYIENPEIDITLPAGGEEEITVKVLPRKRRIQMIEEGVIISK